MQFLRSCFVRNHGLPTYAIPPLLLRLFDGTSNATITEAIDLPIRFTSGVVTSDTFYVTPLDSSCLIVLGSSKPRLMSLPKAFSGQNVKVSIPKHSLDI
jgi:hypothetical protein